VHTTDPVYVKENVWGTTPGEVELQVTDDDGANASVRKTNQPQTTPGFGAVAVLVAVLLGATLARRYR
jgi:PGF-CTERM protein